MHWVVTGIRGQLGSALGQQLEQRGDTLRALAHDDLDVADSAAVRAFFAHLDDVGQRPDRVVNAAAFTHVDRCEREPELARRVNSVAPGPGVDNDRILPPTWGAQSIFIFQMST